MNQYYINYSLANLKNENIILMSPLSHKGLFEISNLSKHGVTLINDCIHKYTINVLHPPR